ncbi:MAG: nucleotidyltransferase family protein [Candidatus Omnitrophica bacterium]|nr:nucleotidyltransferase family protein [Candidatus Omnitrophota bacterium]
MERLKKILIHPDSTIKQALKQMDAMGEKTLITVDANNYILGTTTDGDIRRWVLKGKGINEGLAKVMNSQPLTLVEGYNKETAKKIMLRKQIECLPVVDKVGRVTGCLWWMDLFETKAKIKNDVRLPVVIMAGGEGSRLHPFTKILPKPLMPIGDKPIIEVIVDRFFEHGCQDFYLSLNYKSNLIKAYFSDFEHLYNINYILESKPLGTAGSLHLLRDKIKTTFFVSNCDILIEADYADMLKFHRSNKNKITMVSSMKNFTIPYGVCEIHNGGTLKSIQEKPEHDFLVNTGMYILEPGVLKDIPADRFYHITDLINDYLKKGEQVGVYPVSEKAWLDIGQFEELQETLKKFEV